MSCAVYSGLEGEVVAEHARVLAAETFRDMRNSLLQQRIRQDRRTSGMNKIVGWVNLGD